MEILPKSKILSTMKHKGFLANGGWIALRSPFAVPSWRHVSHVEEWKKNLRKAWKVQEVNENLTISISIFVSYVTMCVYGCRTLVHGKWKVRWDLCRSGKSFPIDTLKLADMLHMESSLWKPLNINMEVSKNRGTPKSSTFHIRSFFCWLGNPPV